jgi:hypothetical protein
MKASTLGQVYGKRFDCSPLRTNHVGAQLARQFGQAIVGKSFRLNFPSFDKVLGMPIFGNYERAQRCAGRRYGLIANLDPPGEASIVHLTTAFTAFAAGDHGRLDRLHRRLRAQARNGDTQSAILADWLDVVLDLLAAEEMQRLLAALRAQVRVDELAELAQVRTEARAQRRRSPRHEHNPVRGQRCPHAPPATSSLPYPEVAAA